MKHIIKTVLLMLASFLPAVSSSGSVIIRDKATKAVIRTSPSPLRADGKIPVDLDPSLEVLDVIDDPQPPFDSATQKLVPSITEQPPASAGFPARLINGWTIISLTQSELDAKAASAASATERDQTKAFVAALRSGQGTQLERLQRVEKACARLILDMYQ